MIEDKKDKRYDLFFFLYLVVFISGAVFFFSQINYSFYGTCFIPSGDWDNVWPLDLYLDEPFHWVATLEIANLIFNILYWFTKDSLLAFNLTPSLLAVCCMVVLYRIANLQYKKQYAAWVVFLFATFPITIVYTKFNIYHIEQTLYLLLAVYFYFKSNYLRKWGYVLLYSLSFMYLVFGEFGEVRSGLLYGGILFLVTVHGLFKQFKRYYLLAIIVFLAVIALIVANNIDFLTLYLGQKAPSWFLEKKSVLTWIKYVSWGMPGWFYHRLLGPVYCVMVIFLVGLDSVLTRGKNISDPEKIVNVFIFLPIGVHVLLFNTTSIYDLFYIYPFLALKCGWSLSRIKDRLVSRKYGVWIRNVFFFFLFCYGLLLLAPVNKESRLFTICRSLKIRSPLVFSVEKQGLDSDLHNGYRHIVADIKKSKSTHELKKVFVFSFRDGSESFGVRLEYLIGSCLLDRIYFATAYIDDAAKQKGSYFTNSSRYDYFLFSYAEKDKAYFDELLKQFEAKNKVKFKFEKRYQFDIGPVLNEILLAKLYRLT